MNELGGLVVLAALAALAAGILTGIVRRHALARGLLDQVNARSSHTVPTPRGGGLAIIAAFLLCWGVAAAWLPFATNEIVGIVGAAFAVALIGWIDDQNHVAAKWRLMVHIVCGAWLAFWLGVPLLPLFDQASAAVFGVLAALTVIGTAWSINLFNFMDGIDGIAAGEAAFIGLAAMALTGVGGGTTVASVTGLMMAAASIGFLFWNWPPAKIFMGDAASGFLGLVVAAMVLTSAQSGEASLAAMLILPALFVVDASVTLFRRVLRRARISAAHRSHVYQRLTRRIGSHMPVTAGYVLVNIAFVFPCAWITSAGIVPPLAGLFVTYVPLFAIAWFLGGGREDDG